MFSYNNVFFPSTHDVKTKEPFALPFYNGLVCYDYNCRSSDGFTEASPLGERFCKKCKRLQPFKVTCSMCDLVFSSEHFYELGHPSNVKADLLKKQVFCSETCVKNTFISVTVNAFYPNGTPFVIPLGDRVSYKATFGDLQKQLFGKLNSQRLHKDYCFTRDEDPKEDNIDPRTIINADALVTSEPNYFLVSKLWLVEPVAPRVEVTVAQQQAPIIPDENNIFDFQVPDADPMYLGPDDAASSFFAVNDANTIPPPVLPQQREQIVIEEDEGEEEEEEEEEQRVVEKLSRNRDEESDEEEEEDEEEFVVPKKNKRNNNNNNNNIKRGGKPGPTSPFFHGSKELFKTEFNKCGLRTPQLFSKGPWKGLYGENLVSQSDLELMIAQTKIYNSKGGNESVFTSPRGHKIVMPKVCFVFLTDLEKKRFSELYGNSDHWNVDKYIICEYSKMGDKDRVNFTGAKTWFVMALPFEKETDSNLLKKWEKKMDRKRLEGEKYSATFLETIYEVMQEAGMAPKAIVNEVVCRNATGFVAQTPWGSGIDNASQYEPLFQV
jgi:hypothetical protein